MARKKHSPPAAPARATPLALLAGLGSVDDQIARQGWEQARALLGALARRYPDHPEVLQRQIDVFYRLGDTLAFLRAARGLERARPDDPTAVLSMLGGYLSAGYPALGIETARRFLDRWPTHRGAAQVTETLTSIEKDLATILAGLALTDPADLPLAVRHDEARWLVGDGQFTQARAVARQGLQERPTFVAMYNLIATCDLLEDKPAAAIATARQGLTIEPENVYLLATLLRGHCLLGQVSEATEVAARLKAVVPAAPAIALKQAEALSLLGDDQGVLAAFRAATEGGIETLRLGSPLFYHLAAVASLRLGDEEQARQHWQAALRLDPRFDLARANVDDLRQPVADRQAPWAFGLIDWLGPRAMQDLQTALLPALPRRDDELFGRGLRRYLRQHPSLIPLVPLLLDRGDPFGRTMAFKTAMMLRTPPLVAALRAFAAGPRGSVATRQEAATVVTEMDRLAGAVAAASALTQEEA